MTDVNEHDGGERDDDVVAAEYVLGVLPDGERREVARRIEEDRAFAMRVGAWEERLAGMNDAFGEERPPSDILGKIEDRLFAPDPARKKANAGLWTSLVFWRGLAVASFAMVAILAGTLVMRDSRTGLPREELVASLSAAESDATFLAVKAADGEIRITRTGAEPPSGRSHELWVIVADRDPISLGLVSPEGTTNTILPADIAGLPDDALTLAVSLEPAGGSPEGKPTGPVIAAGHLKKI
ncbi:MAG: anti-sigma factor [Ahrensia sp.]|nr:anti-sigma factor [Ahrensia sp.]